MGKNKSDLTDEERNMLEQTAAGTELRSRNNGMKTPGQIRRIARVRSLRAVALYPSSTGRLRGCSRPQWPAGSARRSGYAGRQCASTSGGRSLPEVIDMPREGIETELCSRTPASWAAASPSTLMERFGIWISAQLLETVLRMNNLAMVQVGNLYRIVPFTVADTSADRARLSIRPAEILRR